MCWSFAHRKVAELREGPSGNLSLMEVLAPLVAGAKRLGDPSMWADAMEHGRRRLQGDGEESEHTEFEEKLWENIPALALYALVILVLSVSIKRVNQTEVMLIERFGKFQKILKPGIHFIIPLIEAPRFIHWRHLVIPPGMPSTSVKLMTVERDRVDTREHVLDFAKQTVITKDTVAISINALAYFVIRDPRLAVYQIQNLPYAIELLVQSTLRNLLAKITLDDAFSSREQINAEMLQHVAKDAQRWGVEITRVEVVEIEPPPDIKQAMESQITAERARRSAVLQADGLRESTIVSSRGKCAEVILSAEGERTRQIQIAKGEAEAKLMKAKAEADSIGILRSTLDKLGFPQRRAVDYMVSVQYLKQMERLTTRGQNSHAILVPRNVFESLGGEPIPGM